MKYKVGDRVRIKSLDWYRKYANKDGIVVCGNYYFTQNLLKYCGKILMITNVIRDFYVCKDINYQFSDEMIEGLVEEDVDLIPKFGEFSDNEPLDIPTMTTDFIKEHGLPCPDGYIFKDENGNVINATKIVLEKKGKKYLKTYEECKYILGITTPMVRPDYNGDLIVALQKLLICRDAYWKIAGEEMGLGKPWEPDWCSQTTKYTLRNNANKIIKEKRTHDSYVLAFPTEEMRDAFYEAFRNEIEICKELL